MKRILLNVGFIILLMISLQNLGKAQGSTQQVHCTKPCSELINNNLTAALSQNSFTTSNVSFTVTLNASFTPNSTNSSHIQSNFGNPGVDCANNTGTEPTVRIQIAKQSNFDNYRGFFSNPSDCMNNMMENTIISPLLYNDRIILSDNNNVLINLTGLTSGTYYIIGRVGSTKAHSKFKLLGSFNVNIPSPCTTPSGLQITTITTSSASISWTGTLTSSQLFQYQYKKSSEVYNTGTDVLYQTTQTSIDILQLNEATTYNFRVRKKCSSFEYSEWVEITFTTNSSSPPPSLPKNISGTILHNGVGLQGVTINTTNGVSTLTNSNGSYSFQIAQGASTTITPSKNGYTFSPSSISLSNVQSDLTGQDFTASLNCNILPSLTVSNILQTTATINLSGNNSNLIIKYRKTSSSTWEFETNTSSSSYNLTDLAEDTEYSVQISRDCNATETQGVSFRTRKNPIVKGSAYLNLSNNYTRNSNATISVLLKEINGENYNGTISLAIQKQGGSNSINTIATLNNMSITGGQEKTFQFNVNFANTLALGQYDFLVQYVKNGQTLTMQKLENTQEFRKLFSLIGTCQITHIDNITINPNERTYHNDQAINIRLVNALFQTNYSVMPTGNQIGRINGEFWADYRNVNGADCSIPCRNSGNCRHKGIDYHAPQGTPVYSPISGRIIRSVPNNGGVVIWNDQMGISISFWHLNVSSSINVGQDIAEGTLLGTTDNLNHLHKEVRRNNTTFLASACNSNNNVNFPNLDPRVVMILFCSQDVQENNPITVTGFEVSPQSGFQLETNYTFKAQVSGGNTNDPIQVYIRFDDWNEDILLETLPASGGIATLTRQLSKIQVNRPFKYKAVQGYQTAFSQTYFVTNNIRCTGNTSLDIIPLEQWLPANTCQNSYAGSWYGYSASSFTPKKIIIHHTGDPSDAATVQFWRDYANNPIAFMRARTTGGYCASDGGVTLLKYNYFITPDGTIFEGTRGISWHASTFSRHAISVAMVGNFDTPTTMLGNSQRNSLIKLLTYLSIKYNIDPKEFSALLGKNLAGIIGHKDVAQKPCPGVNIYPELSKIRDEVASCLTPPKPSKSYYIATLGSRIPHAKVFLKRQNQEAFQLGDTDKNGLIKIKMYDDFTENDSIFVRAMGYNEVKIKVTSSMLNAKKINVPMFENQTSKTPILKIENLEQAYQGNILAKVSGDNISKVLFYYNDVWNEHSPNQTINFTKLPWTNDDEGSSEIVISAKVILSNSNDTISLNEIVPYALETKKLSVINNTGKADILAYANGQFTKTLSSGLNVLTLPKDIEYEIDFLKDGYNIYPVLYKSLNDSTIVLTNLGLQEEVSYACEFSQIPANDYLFANSVLIKNINQNPASICISKDIFTNNLALQQVSEKIGLKNNTTDSVKVKSLLHFESIENFNADSLMIIEIIDGKPHKNFDVLDNTNKYSQNFSFKEEVKSFVAKRQKAKFGNPDLYLIDRGLPSIFYTQDSIAVPILNYVIFHPDSTKSNIDYSIDSYEQDKIEPRIENGKLIIKRKRGSYENTFITLKAVHDGLIATKTFIIRGITSLEYLNKEFGITLFPVPSEEFVNFAFDKSKVQEFSMEKIISMTGKEYGEQKNLLENSKINISHLSKGIYVFILKINRNFIIPVKIIKN
jgi:murein DD-endopeptidase MepM/ murein hydrolase activator NlpD